MQFSKRYHAGGSKPQAMTPVLFYKMPRYWSTTDRRRRFGTKAQQYRRTLNRPRHQATQRDEDNSFLCIRKGRRTTHGPADETTSYNGSKGKGSVLGFMYLATDACGGMAASCTDNRRKTEVRGHLHTPAADLSRLPTFILQPVNPAYRWTIPS